MFSAYAYRLRGRDLSDVCTVSLHAEDHMTRGAVQMQSVHRVRTCSIELLVSGMPQQN